MRTLTLTPNPNPSPDPTRNPSASANPTHNPSGRVSAVLGVALLPLPLPLTSVPGALGLDESVADCAV